MNTVLTSVPTGPLAIVVDPGHGGEDGGTQGHDILEKNGTLEISLTLARELRKRGHVVVMTREIDETVSLSARRDLANAARRHCFVSIHLNHGDARASGIETFYGWPKRPELVAALRTQYAVGTDAPFADERGRLLAEAVQKGALAATGAQERDIRNERQILVLNSVHCPSVLVECGFVSNKSEAARLKTEAYRQKLASGIADGIEQFLKESASDPRYGIH
ncbi:MAG: N-acetylmuramoyl-L-alanine amidase [Verrucomicrobiales bacterium]|nr:N-acetylmuramoyl-L-alanine amidase [Verrucomicrobiales bacterium]